MWGEVTGPHQPHTCVHGAGMLPPGVCCAGPISCRPHGESAPEKRYRVGCALLQVPAHHPPAGARQACRQGTQDGGRVPLPATPSSRPTLLTRPCSCRRRMSTPFLAASIPSSPSSNCPRYLQTPGGGEAGARQGRKALQHPKRARVGGCAGARVGRVAWRQFVRGVRCSTGAVARSDCRISSKTIIIRQDTILCMGACARAATPPAHSMPRAGRRLPHPQ